MDAALDIQHDDPESGYRFIAGELAARGIAAGEHRAARLSSRQRIWSVFARKRGLIRKSGPPVHDDLASRQFTANRPDELWLTDITEHPTAESKPYLCAIKDASSGWIVGYSMDSRMKAALALAALRNAIALRSPSGTVVVHPVSSAPHAYVRLRATICFGAWRLEKNGSLTSWRSRAPRAMFSMHNSSLPLWVAAQDASQLVEYPADPVRTFSATYR